METKAGRKQQADFVRKDLHYSTNMVVNVRLLCGGEESTAMWKGTVAIELKIVVKPLR